MSSPCSRSATDTFSVFGNAWRVPDGLGDSLQRPQVRVHLALGLVCLLDAQCAQPRVRLLLLLWRERGEDDEEGLWTPLVNGSTA